MWLLFLLIVSLTLRDGFATKDLALNLLLGCLPLGIASVVALAGWRRGTRARREHARGRWRQGVFLLKDGLLVNVGEGARFIPRGAVHALRTPENTGRGGWRRRDRGARDVEPGFLCRETGGGQTLLRVGKLPSSWWSRIAAAFEGWSAEGAAPPARVRESPYGCIARWLPVIVYLHGVLLVWLAGAAVLTVQVGRWVGGENGFLTGFVLGLPMLFVFPLLVTRLLPLVRRSWPALPDEISFETGGGYAVLLGVFATIGTIGIAHQSATWLLTLTAERLPEVKVEHATRFQGRNVLLGLPDARIDASRYGVHQPYVPRAGTHGRHLEPGAWHYVTRLSSRDDPRVCIYLGALQDRLTEATHRRSTAQRVLHQASFYREPLFLVERERGYWKKAVDDLEGEGDRCAFMVVEPVDDPDALEALEWARIGLLMLIMHAVPLALLTAWAWVRYENDW